MNIGRGVVEGWCDGVNAEAGFSLGSAVLVLESRSLGDNGRDEGEGKGEDESDEAAVTNAAEAVVDDRSAEEVDEEVEETKEGVWGKAAAGDI